MLSRRETFFKPPLLITNCQTWVTWESDDTQWNFNPWFTSIILKPKEKKSIKYEIQGPQGSFNRTQLPKLKVETPFTNSAGWETTITFYYQLFYPPNTTAKRINQEIVLDGKSDF